MKITLAMLKRKGACADQVALFRKRHGTEVIITEALCRAEAQDWRWDWAATHLLPAPAYRAWQEAREPAYRAWQEAREPAYRAWQKARAPADRAYQEARATAFARAALRQLEEA